MRGRSWGEAAARIAARLAPDSAARLEREILAVAGVCAVPVGSLILLLDGEAGQRVLAGVAQAVEALRQLMSTPAPGQPLREELDRLLRRRLAQLGEEAADLDVGPPDEAVRPEAYADLPLVGALLELRGVSVELEEELAALHVSEHPFKYPLGFPDGFVIDQRPRVRRMVEVHALADGWITDALDSAGTDSGNAALAGQVDRIALTLGALQTLLSLVQVTEAVIADSGKPDLYDDLEATAATLDDALFYLEVGLDREDVRKRVARASANGHLIVTSYRWSQIVRAAVGFANDVVLSIETGRRMGGVGPALQTATTTGGAPARTITTAALDRLASGALIVQKANPQAGRKIGIRAEKGLGLKPNRARVDIGSIT
jgi:hypothetical protein